MQINDICSENDLRTWLTEQSEMIRGIQLDWVEPGKYGSTMGQPDVNLKIGGTTIGLELKYLLTTRKGIKFTVRPVQRRYHHMTVKRGGKSALLAIEAGPVNKLFLVRGDKIPLRDYVSDPDSGCKGGLEYWLVGVSDADHKTINNLIRILFKSTFWERSQENVA
jgi:hypothetical protein